MLLHTGKRSIFTANQPSWAHGVCADLEMQMEQSGMARGTEILRFNKRTDGCIFKYTTVDYEQLATFGFGKKTGLNIRTPGRILIVSQKKCPRNYQLPFRKFR